MTWEEKVQALVTEGGFSRPEAEAFLEDMGEDMSDDEPWLER